MARANLTSTLLSMDQWSDIMGVSRWELNQFSGPQLNAAFEQCAHVWFQYQWQQDFLSREELAGSIARAENMIAEQLRYWPAPRYIVGEELQYPRNFRRAVFGYGGTARNDWKAVNTRWTKIVLPGIRLFTLIGTPAVTLQDLDGDGINETWTANIATTVTDPTQISVSFQSSDRLGAPIDDTWLLRPVKVTIGSGTVTVVGHSTMLALPIQQQIVQPNPSGLDPTNTALFAGHVEIYWDRCDGTVVPGAGNTANQGNAEWEGDITVPPGSVQTLPIALNARNAEMGIVAPDWLLWGIVNPTTGSGQIPPQPREPDRVVVNYLAGVPYVNGLMNFEMADIVAHLATGILPVGRAGCERSQRIIDWWRQLPSQGESNTRQMTLKEIDNCPFGASRGALFAWARVRELMAVGASVI